MRKSYDIGNGIIKYYGIKPMSLEKEINMPEYAKRTRRNKMEIIDTCNHAKNLIDTIEYRARYAPELDEKKHSDLVNELNDKVKEMYAAIERAWLVGQSK